MNEQNKLISFVVPCYCSAKTIRSVVGEIISTVENETGYDYEIILINDCSLDDTFEEIKRLQKDDHRIVAIDLCKNFGQASAQMAGFGIVKGDYVFSLDDDGQMPIESIFEMINKIDEGYDVVFGRYNEVKQKWYRNLGSEINVKMSEILIGKPKDLYISSFWVSSRRIIDEVVKYNGPFPYIGGLLLRVTRNMTSVSVNQRERLAGTSGYTFGKLIRLWLNGFTAFSIIPLRIASSIGILCSFAGFVYGACCVVRKVFNPNILLGYSSLITIILLIGGILMMLMGMLGEYMGRIYLSINQTPQYVIRQSLDYREY